MGLWPTWQDGRIPTLLTDGVGPCSEGEMDTSPASHTQAMTYLTHWPVHVTRLEPEPKQVRLGLTAFQTSVKMKYRSNSWKACRDSDGHS